MKYKRNAKQKYKTYFGNTTVDIIKSHKLSFVLLILKHQAGEKYNSTHKINVTKCNSLLRRIQPFDQLVKLAIVGWRKQRQKQRRHTQKSSCQHVCICERSYKGSLEDSN